MFSVYLIFRLNVLFCDKDTPSRLRKPCKFISNLYVFKNLLYIYVQYYTMNEHVQSEEIYVLVYVYIRGALETEFTIYSIKGTKELMSLPPCNIDSKLFLSNPLAINQNGMVGGGD